MKTSINQKLMPVQRIRFAEDTGGIFEDKLQKGRTGHCTEKRLMKQEAPTKSTTAANRRC